MRTPRRVDANHAVVVEALRKVGCKVMSMASLGRGAPDLLVWSPRTKRLRMLEIKDGAKPPSARKLTEQESVFAKEWGDAVATVYSVDDAMMAVGFLVRIE